MNNIAFQKGTGLILNEVIIPNTDNASWEELVLRLSGKKVSITLTNELALNGNMAVAGPFFAGFHVPQDTATSFLQNASFTSRVYSWESLFLLKKTCGLELKQGIPTDSVANNSIVVVVSRGRPEELSFSFCYAYEVENAAA